MTVWGRKTVRQSERENREERKEVTTKLTPGNKVVVEKQADRAER